jgi:hypothetical protein
MPLDAVSGLAGPDIDPLNLIVSITLEKQTTRGLEEEVEAVVVDSVPFDPLILFAFRHFSYHDTCLAESFRYFDAFL